MKKSSWREWSGINGATNMGGKPKGGTKPDGRLSKNRSKNYKGGDKTKAAGKPTGPNKGNQKRVGEK